MFSSACAIAKDFTFPIIISYRQYDGVCNCGLGAFVMINDDGWAVTANHIISQIQNMYKLQLEYHDLLKQRQAIQDDVSLKNHIKTNKLNSLRILPTTITHFSVYLSDLGSGFEIIHQLPEVDLAVFKIRGYDKSKVNQYPLFKDPAKLMSQGTSLCKLGFPFHAIVPTCDTDKNAFKLPDGALPVPLFPIDGIFTREIIVSSQSAYPLKFIETSTPGLKGQSGGATFDVNGYIWAIQSQTQSYKLDFGENAGKSKEAEHMKNQYLNVGIGIHAETIINFLNQFNISFLISPN